MSSLIFTDYLENAGENGAKSRNPILCNKSFSSRNVASFMKFNYSSAARSRTTAFKESHFTAFSSSQEKGGRKGNNNRMALVL